MTSRFSPSLVVSILALVVATTGVGSAASAGGQPGASGANKSNRTKGRAVRRGPRGPQGLQGPLGPVGPKGDTGGKGDAGPRGPSDDYRGYSKSGGVAWVDVPPGDYAVVGHSTAVNSSTAYATAGCFLQNDIAGTTPDAAYASVPNSGYTLNGGHEGFASLSNATTFELPSGGRISEFCVDQNHSDGTHTYTDTTVVATQVATRHP